MSEEAQKNLEPESFSGESITLINVPKTTDRLMMLSQNKLRFVIKEKQSKEVAFEMIFNSMFGLRFINHRADALRPKERYIDIDIDLNKSTDMIFVILHDKRIYVSIGGLSFADIVYSGAFHDFKQETGDIMPKRMDYFIEFDDTYTKPAEFKGKYSYEVLATSMYPAGRHNQVIPENLESQLLLVNMSQETADEDQANSDSIGLMQGKKLFYEETYTNGEWCDAKNRPRETKVLYYCDQYHFQKDASFKILDASEPDYCKYQIKVATKFLCTAGN